MFRWVEADPDPLGIISTHGQLVSMSDRAVIEHLRGLALEPVHGQPRQQQEAQIVEVGDRLGPRLRLLLPRRALLDRAQALRPVPSRTNSAMVLGE